MAIFTPRYQYSLVLLLRRNPKRKHDHSYTVLMLCNRGDDSEESSASLVATDTERKVTPYHPMEQMFVPDDVGSHAVVEISGEIIVGMSEEPPLTVNCDRIIEDYKQRQIPRFRWGRLFSSTAVAPGVLFVSCRIRSGTKPLLRTLSEQRSS